MGELLSTDILWGDIFIILLVINYINLFEKLKERRINYPHT